MVAVMVGRFQVPELHAGHKALFDQVAGYDKHLIFVNVSQDRPRALPFQAVCHVLSDYWRRSPKELLVVPLLNMHDNMAWVHQLERMTDALAGRAAVMVGGRNSFLDVYRAAGGSYPTVQVEEKDLSQEEPAPARWDSVLFRQGVLYENTAQPAYRSHAVAAS